MAEFTHVIQKQGEQIDFLKYRYVALLFSVALVVTGIVGYIYNGGFAYSVDFSGGTQVVFHFNPSVGSDQLRSTLAKQGRGDVVIRELGGSDVVVRVNEFTTDVAGLAQQMKDELHDQFPGVVINVVGDNCTSTRNTYSSW